MQTRSWDSPIVVVISTLMILCLVCGTGCGGGGYAGPTGTVSGGVKLAGQPVPDGSSVTFVSDAGHTANGIVAGGGKYQLSVIANDGSKSDRVPAGKYRVSVGPPSDSKPMSDAEYEKMMNASAGGEAPQTAPNSAIPVKYHTTVTSQLSFEVKEGPNTIDIDLK